MNEYNPESLTKETLRSQIEESKEILNNKTYEYLMKLLNLQDSAINNQIVTKEILIGLKNLAIFNSLIIYNLYNLAKRNITDKQRMKANMYGFLIESTETAKTELLRFTNREMSLSLHDKQPLNEKQQLEAIEEQIKKLEQRLEFLNNNSYNVSKTEKSFIKSKLDILKQATPERIKTQYEIEYMEYELQKQMTEQFLNENNLTENDFEEMNMRGRKKFLIKKYPHTTIYIEK